MSDTKSAEGKIAEAQIGHRDHEGEQTMEVVLCVSGGTQDNQLKTPWEFKRVEIRARGGNRDNYGISVTLQGMERHTVRWLIEALTKVEPFLTDGDKDCKFEQLAASSVPAPVLSSYDRTKP
jgi:hypothetical protein